MKCLDKHKSFHAAEECFLFLQGLFITNTVIIPLSTESQGRTRTQNLTLNQLLEMGFSGNIPGHFGFLWFLIDKTISSE